MFTTVSPEVNATGSSSIIPTVLHIVNADVQAKLADTHAWERRLPYASIELDASGNVRQFNPLANDMFGEQSPFKLQNGRLIPFLPDDLPIWLHRLNKILDDRQAGFVILNGSYSRVAVALLPSSQGVEVRVRRNDTAEDETLRLFAQSAEITLAERDVLRLIISGLKPAVIAKVRCRSEATVRSHIKSLLHKTGCTSIQELVSLVAGLPSMA